MFLKFRLFFQDKLYNPETESYTYVACDTCKKKFKVETSERSFYNHCSHDCKIRFFEEKKFKCKRCKEVYNTLDNWENYDYCSEICASLALEVKHCARCGLPFYNFVNEQDTTCLRLNCYRGAKYDYYNNYKRKRQYWIESLIQIHNYQIKSGYTKKIENYKLTKNLKHQESTLVIDGISVDAISQDKEKTVYIFYSDYYHNPNGTYNPKQVHPELHKTFRQIMEETNVRAYTLESKGYRIGYITEAKYDALQIDIPSTQA